MEVKKNFQRHHLKIHQQSHNMPKPAAGTYPAFTEKYINLVDANNIEDIINTYSDSIVDFFNAIPEEKLQYRYANDKWNIKEVLQHVIDTERIFSYRALCIARGDATHLPGFDENAYVLASNANNRDWEELLIEYEAVRLATDVLLESFTPEQQARVGTTNGSPNSVNAIAYTIFGHTLHHINILKERYLQ